jgi:hypothetical protein
MKFLKVIILALLPVFAYSQDSFVKDSIWYYTDLNQCDSVVWWIGYQVKLRGKIVSMDARPVGYDEKNPCANIREKDTTTLVNFYKNTLVIDPGRQLAEIAVRLFLQNQLDKEAERVNSAIKKATKKDFFQEAENAAADSLFGNYRLRTNINGTVKTVDCQILRRPNGQVVIRTGTGQTVQNYPLKFWGDARIEVTDLPLKDNKTMIYRIQGNRGRWVSFDRSLQVLKSDKFAIENLGFK